MFSGGIASSDAKRIALEGIRISKGKEVKE